MSHHKSLSNPDHQAKPDHTGPAPIHESQEQPAFGWAGNIVLPLSPRYLTPQRILNLQRTVGNQAAQQVLRQIQRQDNPLKAKKDRWYENVALVIIELAEREGISLEQAMFIIAQAQAEQGVGDPAKRQYRIFNIMPTFAEEKELKLNPQEGITTKRIKAPEEINGKIVIRESPFYVYDSLERSVGHYFDRLGERYQGALAVLKNSKGKIHEFATALQRQGYATSSTYVPHVIKQYRIVLREMKTFLRGKIDEEGQNLARAGGALTQEWGIVKGLWKQLNEKKAERQQSTDDAHMREIEDRIRQLEAELKEHETVLKDIETFIKDRKEQVKKLEKLRDGLESKQAAQGEP